MHDNCRKHLSLFNIYKPVAEDNNVAPRVCIVVIPALPKQFTFCNFPFTAKHL